MQSDAEVNELLKTNERLRRLSYLQSLALYILLTITVCAVVIAAALVASVQP